MKPELKISLIYDNTSLQKGLIADFGFSCLIEAHNKKILFDTGSNGSILLQNMKKLKINPKSIDEIFISHSHFDHIGGLSAFININNNISVHVPVSLRGIRNVKKVIYYDKPEKIHDNFYSTGELERLEQSLAVKTGNGIFLIVGCSHPEMNDIFNAVSRYGQIQGIIGGLHAFNKIELFEQLKLICPCHCTKFKQKIKSCYPEKYVEGGAGKIIEVFGFL